MSRHLLPHRLQSILQTAAATLSLPLNGDQLERLALELSPAVRALLAEAVATAEETAPVRFAVARDAELDDQAGVQITEYAGCVCRISLDVDLDSPAAALAAELRERQPDVIATDVPSATYLGLTVRPQSLHAWRWWLDALSITPESVTVQDTAAYAVGQRNDVAVHLRGDGVGTLLTIEACCRPGLDIDWDSPAGTVASKVRRQPDVTATAIRDAHSIDVTVKPKSLVEWQWWLHELSIPPGTVTFDGTAVLATGSKDGATVRLRGDDARFLYDDEGAARLMGLLAEPTTG